MTHTLGVGMIVGTLGALLYVVLGLWVFTLTPRRRQTILLGAYAVLLGAGLSLVDWFFILDVIGFFTYEPVVIGPFSTAAWLVALTLAASVAGGLERRRSLRVAVALGFGFSALVTLAFLVSDPPYYAFDNYAIDRW